MPRTPSAFPFSGRLRRRAINPTPPKRVKAWGEGPLRPEVMYPVVEHTRPNRAARNHSRSRAPHHRTQKSFAGACGQFLNILNHIKKEGVELYITRIKCLFSLLWVINKLFSWDQKSFVMFYTRLVILVTRKKCILFLCKAEIGSSIFLNKVIFQKNKKKKVLI